MALNTVYDLYDVARMSANFQVASVDTDPTTVSLKYRDPNGTVTEVTYAGGGITKDSTGDYHADVTVTIPGLWTYRFRGTGTAADSDEGEFFVKPARAL